MKRVVFPVLAAALLWHAAARAELPPQVYEEMQAEAPESLVIETRTVSQELVTRSLTRITVTARVVSVARSASGLEPGDGISIVYERRWRPPGWTGPGPVPILGEGRRYRAYLHRVQDGTHYAPAARGRSFPSAE